MTGQMFQLGKQEGVLVRRAAWGQGQLLLEVGCRKSRPGVERKEQESGIQKPEVGGWDEKELLITKAEAGDYQGWKQGGPRAEARDPA